VKNESNDNPPPEPQSPAPDPGDSPPPTPPAPIGGAGAPLSEADSRLWAMLAHLLGIVGLFVAPLVVMLMFGPRSAFVEKHAKEALNFQIIITIAVAVSMLLTGACIGVPLLFAVEVTNLIFCIIAGLEANKGNDYRYPFNYPFVK
jgi:uncharacterized Tic20 family protein